MKKDVFSVWLKEFCSLVFTQTVQAFLLAIIMSVVLYMANDGGEQQYSGNSVSAVSIIAIIALSSISKIELLVKKIFGVESQFGDPAMKNGVKSFSSGIAAGMATINLAKRPADNLKKFVGGIKDIRSSNMDIARIGKRKSRDLLVNSKKEHEALMAAKKDKENVPDDQSPIGTQPTLFPGESQPDFGPYDSQKLRDSHTFQRTNDTNKQVAGGVNDFPGSGGQNGNTTGATTGDTTGIGSNLAGHNISTIANAQLTGNISTIQGVSGGVSGHISGGVGHIDAPNARVDGGKDSSGKSSKVSLLDYEEKRNAINDKYDDALSEAKKKRKKAITQTASGVTETLTGGFGALSGATLKTVIDLAQGDASLSSTIKAGITGAGIGDIIGEKVTTAVSSGLSSAKNLATGNTRGAKMEKIKNETIKNVTELKHYDAANNNIINNNPSIIKTETRYEQPSAERNDVKYRSLMKYLNNSQNGKRVIREQTKDMDNKKDLDSIY